MTSNIGSDIIQNQWNLHKGIDTEELFDKTRHLVFEALKAYLRPEFLNRIDDIVMFKPLSKNEIREVVTIQINEIKTILEKSGFDIHLTDNAIDFLAQAGYDPQYGARPVKRVIKKMLLNELSKLILAGTLNKEAQITVDANDKKLSFSNI